MRYSVTRQRTGRAVNVIVEGKRNNWIPRTDQGEIENNVGVTKVGQKVVLKRGDKHYRAALIAAPDISDDTSRLEEIATNIADAVNDTIEDAVAATKQDGGTRVPSPYSYLLVHVIKQLQAAM
jgi:hypothetical protein